MKKSIFLFLALASIALFFGSCSVDTAETLPGTWSTSDGGTITFNAGGTGTTANSDFFEFDCGSLNGQQIGPIPNFTWTITSGGSKDNLRLEFDDQTSFASPCSGSMEFPIEFKGKNNATVGASALGFSIQVDLSR